jgi:hypothetical protein
MFRRSLRGFVALLNRTYLHVGRPTARLRRRTFRPELELLEGRIVPAVDVWTGANHAVDNNWSDGKNWSLLRAPTSSDVASFSGGAQSNTSVVDQNFTVGGLQINGAWNGTIIVNSTLTLAKGSTNEWDGGSLNVPQGDSVVNNGTLTLNSTAGVTLGGGGTFTNNGLINQQGAGDLAIAGTNVATTLINSAGAAYDFLADSSIVYGGGNSGGAVSNAGTIEKTAATGTSKVAQPLTNNGGTLDAQTGTLGIATNSNNTNGTYHTAAGATLDLTGGSGVTFTENGAFTAAGNGTLMLDNGALAIGSGGATFAIPGTVSFQWSGGSVNVPVNATLAVNGNLALTGSAGETLGGGGTLAESGTITQSGAGNLAIAGNSVATTLNILSGSVYDFTADSSIVYGGGASGGAVTNAGTIEKTAGTGTSKVAQPLTNTGTLDAATGILQIDANSSNTGGTYQAAAGATLDLTGGQTFSETGTFTAAGAGTITLGGGTFSVYNNAATLSIPSTLAFQWPGGAINVPVNDTLTVSGNLTFAGTSNELLEGGGTLTENGTITQSGSGNLAIAGNTVATTLVIPAGSVYDFAANSGIVYGGGASGGAVTNAGTIEKTAGGATSTVSAAFNNSGTLSAQSGTLSLAATGGESTGGVFNVGAGAILDLTGGNGVTYSGTYTGSGSGEVLLGSGTLDVAGGSNGATFNLTGNLFVWSGGAINTNGDPLTILGNVQISGAYGSESLTGGGSLNVGSSSAAGTVNDKSAGNTLNVGSGTTLAIQSKGTFNLGDSTINGNGALTNAGLLRKQTGTSGATVAVNVDNPGKAEVDSGTLVFSGAVNQIYNNTLTGGSWTTVGSASVPATLTISSGSFTTIGPSASVTLNGVNSAFTNLANLAANQGSLSLLGGQSASTAGNFTNSGSLTTSPGSVLSVNGNFTQTATGTDNVQIGGTTSHPIAGAISATGRLMLAGALKVVASLLPAVGTSFVIANNLGSMAVLGMFLSLPEGATFPVKVGSTTMTFQITYQGGDGNDVVLTRIA